MTTEHIVDNSFERFLSHKPDGNPVIMVGLPIKVFEYEQNDRYNLWRKDSSRENLEKVFNLFGEQPNLKSLKIDNSSPLPFTGEWWSKISVGRDVTIGGEAVLMGLGGISLGNDAVIGEKSMLITVGHPIHPAQRHMNVIGPISIHDNVLIGADSAIINSGKAKPVVIGEGSIIMPGAIVTKDVPPCSVVTGTNNILFSGKEFFIHPRDLNDDNKDTLAGRLSPQGMMRLASIELLAHTDVTRHLATAIKLKLESGTKIYQEQSGDFRKGRDAFFSNTPSEVLDSCMIPSPVYVKGDVPHLARGMVVNMGCAFDSHKTGKIELSDGVLLAPLVSLSSDNNASIKLEPQAWCGAKAHVKANGEQVTIGYGSIVASGAHVDKSVPPMSIVMGDGVIVRQIDDKDMMPVHPSWNNVEAYRAYQSENVHKVQKMSPAARQHFISNALSKA